MSHLAFRRDTSDDQLIVRFAVDVGSPEVLRMLFLLTAADFAAVGPGVLNEWKSEVLADLYQRTMRHLAGDLAVGQRRGASERTCSRLVRDEPDAEWFAQQVASLAELAVIQRRRADRIAEQLRQLADSDGGRSPHRDSLS